MRERSWPLEILRRPPPPLAEPADFDDFWRHTWRELTAAPLDWRVERTYHDQRLGGRVERLSFRSATGERVSAWITHPGGGPDADDTEVQRGMVVGHGYGGRPDGPEDLPFARESAKIFPCAPGLPPNRSAHIPSLAAQHVLHGIGARETYVHRFCVADIWRATSVLLARFPGISHPLDYAGASFGGGIGALALPWDDRFGRAHLHVPSFGHHPLRLAEPCTGSGESVRRFLAEAPGSRPVLDYFDAAIAASRIRIPVHVSAARLDPAVPPRGQYAVYHALAGPKRLFVQTAGHVEYDGEAEETARRNRELAEFFTPDGSAESLHHQPV
jgi:cephalosporin-C deacetylase